MKNRFDSPTWRNYIKDFCKAGVIRLDAQYGAEGELISLFEEMEN